MTKEIFIEKIAKYVCKYAPDYDILCPSAVIAQAILESGWGESALAARYHNGCGFYDYRQLQGVWFHGERGKRIF